MKKLIYILPVAGILLLALAGCTSLNGQNLADDPDTDEGATALASGRLYNDPMVASATLSVSVEDGLGILYGTVPNEMVRQRALQILAATPGIYEVLDRTRKR